MANVFQNERSTFSLVSLQLINGVQACYTKRWRRFVSGGGGRDLRRTLAPKIQPNDEQPSVRQILVTNRTRTHARTYEWQRVPGPYCC
jgi:hypothetical protein